VRRGPGIARAFVVSTTSTNWNKAAYYNPITREERVFPAIVANPGELYADAIFVPDNAIRVSIIIAPNRFSQAPFPNLPIYVSRAGIPTGPGDAEFVKNNNRVVMPPDGPVPAGIPLYFAIDNNTGGNVTFNLITELLLTNENGNVTTVLGNQNRITGKKSGKPGVVGNNNVTTVIGDGNKVTPKHKNGAGVKGDNNITTIVGNDSKASAKGNGNITSVFGNRSKARSAGDNKVSTAVGDDKKNVNGTDVS
jgi:hypothetical protein